jgi:hypothetical protein
VTPDVLRQTFSVMAIQSMDDTAFAPMRGSPVMAMTQRRA